MGHILPSFLRRSRRTAAVVAAGLLAYLPMAGAQAQAPAWRWAAQTTATAASGDMDVVHSGVDAQGNTYVTGELSNFSGPLSRTFGSTTLTAPGQGEVGFLAKLSPTGQWLWAITIADETEEMKVAVDAAGNAYVVGAFSEPTLTVGTVSLARVGNENNVFVGRISPRASASGCGEATRELPKRFMPWRWPRTQPPAAWCWQVP